MSSYPKLILELLLQLIPIMKPSDLQKIKNAIEEREKKINEEKRQILKAVVDGDIDTINRLLLGE